MTQEWHHVLFAHWPVPASALRGHVPAELEIDTFEGSAWIGIVPFLVKDMRARLTPAVPFLSSFIEVNVRTYVRYKEKTGVYFFSLDANHFLAVTGAKLFFGLPYKQATISFQEDQSLEIDSSRVPLADEKAKFKVSYKPETDVFFAKAGTLEHWFTERYCLWTKRGSMLYRGDIHHTQWELQRAKANLFQEELIPFVDQIHLQEPPLLHYSKFKKAFFWPLKPEE